MMDVEERIFIYEQLKFLKEQNSYKDTAIASLTQNLDIMSQGMTELISIVDRVVGQIEKMQSPDYAVHQSNVARAKDVADKIAFIRNFNKK
jgi:hypothetical protein